MDVTFIYSTAMILLMLTDPFGNLPVFLATLKPVPKRRQAKVLFRELCIALVAMVLALSFGHAFFGLLQIEGGALTIAGGLVLLLTGIKMIFSTLAEVKDGNPGGTLYCADGHPAHLRSGGHCHPLHLARQRPASDLSELPLCVAACLGDSNLHSLRRAPHRPKARPACAQRY